MLYAERVLMQSEVLMRCVVRLSRVVVPDPLWRNKGAITSASCSRKVTRFARMRAHPYNSSHPHPVIPAKAGIHSEVDHAHRLPQYSKNAERCLSNELQTMHNNSTAMTTSPRCSPQHYCFLLPSVAASLTAGAAFGSTAADLRSLEAFSNKWSMTCSVPFCKTVSGWLPSDAPTIDGEVM